MTPSHLGKLFTALGLVLVTIAVNTWLASQGAKAILKLPLLHEERPAAAFLALCIGSALLAVLGAIGLLHASRTGGSWHARVPPVWLDGLDTASREGRIFQITVLIVFVGLPVVSFIHFADIVWSAKLCVLGSKAPAVYVSDAWRNGIPGAHEQIRLVADLLPDGSCGQGIQVFPGWEFAVLAVLLAGSTGLAALFVAALSGLWSPPPDNLDYQC